MMVDWVPVAPRRRRFAPFEIGAGVMEAVTVASVGVLTTIVAGVAVGVPTIGVVEVAAAAAGRPGRACRTCGGLAWGCCVARGAAISHTPPMSNADAATPPQINAFQIGRASCRERV